MAFRRDLVVGNKAEAMVQAILLERGVKNEVNDNPKKNKDYDLTGYLDKDKFTLEVKYDIYAARSGNVAIEYFNPKVGKASGVGATKADLWVHIITKPMSVWVTSTKRLRDFIEKNPPFKVIACGGDNNASLYLYRQDFIFDSIFYRIDETTQEALVTILKTLLV